MARSVLILPNCFVSAIETGNVTATAVVKWKEEKEDGYWFYF